MYYIPNRKKDMLYNIIKKHCAIGSIIFTDSASMYTDNCATKSRLSPRGYYHFWVNHSMHYVHHKFLFVHTSKIETAWGRMKRCSVGIHHQPSLYSV